MAIEVKDISGNNRLVHGRGVSGSALGLGIAGTALGVLNSGGLFGLGGANRAAEMAVIDNCFIDKDQYYQERIQDIKDNNARFTSIAYDICDLRSQIAVNTTANSYQNRITDIGFANVDNRFTTENIINNLNRQLAICEATKNVVRGEVFLSPRNLADNFIAPVRVLDSHEAREYLPGHRFMEGCAPCGGHF